ncbi:endoplasmic reticulum protein [Crucibulum laeve]|uniref:Endoplasmic reticulum protein n=1 Tax=Crucibulum laeve TaxID=68775 RepID=A0A5C3M7X7_9AGAR|nr:endoplasmic reticulum protein [Crucibulum laeve]
MFRRTIVRTVHVVSRQQTAALAITRPTASHFAVRFNSTQPPSSTKAPLTPEQQAKREIHDRQDNLQRDWDAKVLTYDELLPKTESPSPDAYLIDVREPDEVIQGMIPSAVNLPLSVLGNSLHLSREAFKQKHGFDKPRKDQEITFYCRSGMRSTTASDVAKRNGFVKILNYKGSWLEWTDKQNQKKSA